jgi:hypothetical protein
MDRAIFRFAHFSFPSRCPARCSTSGGSLRGSLTIAGRRPRRDRPGGYGFSTGISGSLSTCIRHSRVRSQKHQVSTSCCQGGLRDTPNVECDLKSTTTHSSAYPPIARARQPVTLQASGTPAFRVPHVPGTHGSPSSLCDPPTSSDDARLRFNTFLRRAAKALSRKEEEIRAAANSFNW